MNEFPYIIKTIMRAHITVAVTMIALISLSFMVVGNAAPVIFSTLHSLYSSSGLQEHDLGILHIENDPNDAQAIDPSRILSELQSVPGIVNVAAISSLPLQNQALTFNPLRERGQNAVPQSTTAYLGSSGFMTLLGIKIISGRDFEADEYAKPSGMLPSSKVTIISQDLADYLWPQGEPLGKMLIASDENAYRVVGVASRVAETHPSSLAKGQLVAFFPAIVGSNLNDTFIFRYDHSVDAGALFDRIAARIHQILPLAAYSRPRSFEQLRSDYFAQSVRTSWALGIICLVVVLTMATGVGGLAAHWLRQRTRSIAIKRSLGASQWNIVQYFVVENCSISILGVLLGAILAVSANQWLLRHFEIQRVNIIYFAGGGILFVLINLASIVGPIRRSILMEPSQVFRH